MRLIISAAIVLLLYSCKAVSIGKKEAGPDPVMLTQMTSPVVILDASISDFSGTRNGRLTEQTKKDYCQRIRAELRSRLGREIIVDTITADSVKQLLVKGDSRTVLALQKQYNSALLFVLKDCSGGIVKDNTLTKLINTNNSAEPVNYTIYLDANWLICEQDKTWNRTINVKEERSEKTKKGGWLSTGPAYENKQEDLGQLSSQSAMQLSLLMRYK